jgi:hypothetical protein
VRYTDYQCDYVKLYQDNKALIQAQKSIYIASDNKSVVEWFQGLGLSATIYNFTKFPEGNTGTNNLHYSTIDSDTKFKDMVSDMCIIGLANILLSNSLGLFINLCRQLNENKSLLQTQLGLPIEVPPPILPSPEQIHREWLRNHLLNRRSRR